MPAAKKLEEPTTVATQEPAPLLGKLKYIGGSLTKIRLEFVQAFIDRHGRTRHYFRRRGFKRVPLPGRPGSEEFMAAYGAAFAGETAEPIKIGAARTKPGTVNAAIAGFYRSAAFLDLQPITKSTYRGILESFRSKHGDKRIEMLERRHILDLLAEKAGKPGAQRNLLRMLNLLLAFEAIAKTLKILM